MTAKGWTRVVFLVVLAVAVVVIVLVMRSAAAGGSPQGRLRPPRAPRPPRSARPRPLAPDDDPDFLRDLSRRTRRDDGSPT